jgi:hypothetical protein
MKVLSLIPPMTQLNTPYPSTAYLTGFLRSRGVDAVQEDLALALVLSFFNPEGLAKIHAQAVSMPEEQRSASVNFFLDYFAQYQATISPVIAFLQGRDSTLSHRINTRSFLPEGPRFAPLDEFDDEVESGDPLSWAFGALGSQDRARHLATLYLNDLADVLRDAVDDRFEFVRYAESLASSQPTFTPLEDALNQKPTLMDLYLQGLTSKAIQQHQPDLVLLSVPFPGAMYAALRIAQEIKRTSPEIKIGLGGGYVNTELRELSDPRIFDYVDFITLDSGERPLLALLEHLNGKRSAERLVRTFIRNKHHQVQYCHWQEPDVPFEEVGTATWDGLPLDSYLSLLDMLNPMHRLWSDGRWNKLTVAHGCYWKKCSFCDVSLDYISRYETASASLLVDRIEQIVAETGQTGFHFVDEAAPPKALKALAKELIRRKVAISWWGNIRFEKTFTPELAELLARSGCIAMSGGLEVASDRLLSLMKKGVSVEQVARVTKGFSDAGILVHAYLMYGFPTQTVQETVDALEYVRQLFEHGCIQSGFFHRFVCTAHSPVGLNPEEYGIKLIPLPEITFAKNDIAFIDPSGVNHDALGYGLKKALYNYMHGVGFDIKAHFWFKDLNIAAPKTTVPKSFVEKALNR